VGSPRTPLQLERARVRMSLHFQLSWYGAPQQREKMRSIGQAHILPLPIHIGVQLCTRAGYVCMVQAWNSLV
jgi:hypothetical protein